MHELSLCQALLEQIARQLQPYPGYQVQAIWLQIGPLAGVESELLAQAYPLAAAGSVAAQAQLHIEKVPVRVRCLQCNAECEVLPNHLQCPLCGHYHTQVIQGDALILARLEISPVSSINC